MSPKWVGHSDSRTSPLEALEWVFVIARACHDLHSSFKWSLCDAFADRDTLRDGYIGVEAVRSFFDVALTLVAEWIDFCASADGAAVGRGEGHAADGRSQTTLRE